MKIQATTEFPVSEQLANRLDKFVEQNFALPSANSVYELRCWLADYVMETELDSLLGMVDAILVGRALQTGMDV